MRRGLKRIEYSAKDKDGKDITGMVRSDLKAVEALRNAVHASLSEAGFDVAVEAVRIHGYVPWGETRIIQMDGANNPITHEG